MVWILAAQLTWPSAKIKINGNGFGPGSGQESVQKTLASPASTACGPDWSNRPSPKEILLYKCKNRSRFFILAGGQPVPCLTPRNSPGWRAKPFTFFYFSRKPARAGHGPARAKPLTVHVFLFLFCRPAGDPPLPPPPPLKHV